MSKTKDAEVPEKYEIESKLPRELTRRILILILAIALCAGIYYIPPNWFRYIHENRAVSGHIFTQDVTPRNPVITIGIRNLTKRFFTYEEKFYLYRYTGDEDKYINDMSKYEEIVLRDNIVFSSETYSLGKDDLLEQIIDLRDYIDGSYLGRYKIVKELTEYSKEGGKKIASLPYYFDFVIEAESE